VEKSKLGINLSRMLAIFSNDSVSVATQDGALSVPMNGMTFEEGLKFSLSDKAERLRKLLEPKLDKIEHVVGQV
jgi:hypothetical protein